MVSAPQNVLRELLCHSALPLPKSLTSLHPSSTFAHVQRNITPLPGSQAPGESANGSTRKPKSTRERVGWQDTKEGLAVRQ